jgi:hypothetical protein
MDQSSDTHLVFSEYMPTALRVGIALFGLFPWIAPYELLIRPKWQGFGPFLAFALLISLGAIVASVVFWLVALLGLNRRTVLDPRNQTISDGSSNVLMSYHEKQYSFHDVAGFKVITHDWSEGPSTYELSMHLKKGHEIKFGKFDKQKDAEAVQANLTRLVLGT